MYGGDTQILLYEIRNHIQKFLQWHLHYIVNMETSLFILGAAEFEDK